MLAELRVRDLGVIADLTLNLQPGMTALTGETGAGKTLLVDAIDLLVGGRAGSVVVRPGAEEAWVEGRFVTRTDEVVLSRVVPAGGGRSRGYMNGRMVPIATLAEVGTALVDLHGQHAHQSLLHAVAQREALDAFAGIDLEPLVDTKSTVKQIETSLGELGGDTRARAREVDLLRFQISEIEQANISDPDEDAALAAEEERLADASAHRDAAWAAYEALQGDGGAADAIGTAVSAVAGRSPLAAAEERLRALSAEAADLAGALRALAESIEDDPARLEQVRARRVALREVCRKYGDTLAEVLAFANDTAARLEELEGYDATAARLENELEQAREAVRAEQARVAALRRAAAPRLADAVAGHLRQLAMPHARLDVVVGDDDPGDEVRFLLGANPGEPPLPLASVASGGELARTMLAARMVLTTGPPTLVFDEVDAGVGGEAALSVGRSLAALAGTHQVLVVTHLPQVAAFADHQVAVTKRERDGRTVADAVNVVSDDRVVELSRMLSGNPGSKTAQGHAEELLDAAARERQR